MKRVMDEITSVVHVNDFGFTLYVSVNPMKKNYLHFV
jgi:hypothetical protein